MHPGALCFLLFKTVWRVSRNSYTVVFTLKTVALLCLFRKKFYAPKSTSINVAFCLSAFQRYREDNLPLMRRSSLPRWGIKPTEQRIIVKNWRNTTFYCQYFSAYELDSLMIAYSSATFTHFYCPVYIYLPARISCSNAAIKKRQKILWLNCSQKLILSSITTISDSSLRSNKWCVVILFTAASHRLAASFNLEAFVVVKS